MHHRSFAAHRSAEADGRGRGQRSTQARPDTHPAAPERGRFHHLGHPLGLTAGHDEMDEQSNRQPPQCRHQKEAPPGKLPGQAEHLFRLEAKGAQLDQADQVAEDDGRARGERAEHRAEDEYHHLPVADHAA